jgi:transposase
MENPRRLFTAALEAPDAKTLSITFFTSAGQISDYTGAAALLKELPEADWPIAVRGYDADWFRDALKDREIEPCIPGRKACKVPVKYDKRRYKRRNRIEIRFGRIKNRLRIATRIDRCPKVILSAVALSSTVLF